jgi:hypothetical protein
MAIDEDDWGDPIVVELAPSVSKAGRPNQDHKVIEWFDKLNAPTKEGEKISYELKSREADEAHPVSRVTKLKKLAANYDRVPIKIETRPVEAGKRYKIYATVGGPKEAVKPSKNGKKASTESADLETAS